METAEEVAKEMKVEAKKYGLTYEEYDDGSKTDIDILDKMLHDPKLPEIKQLVIGCWSFESGDCSELVKGMVEHKEKFAHIEGLFWGDIDYEESEISWIEQTDLGPLLDGMPQLKDLKIKGTNGLGIGRTSRPNLRSLEIISGGLPASVIEDVIQSDFPNLEKLILYVGIDEYGFDGTIDQFTPLFSKEKFPKLTYLGIVNAEEQDQIVQMFLDSDMLPQLEIMDISCGVLTDKGGQLLLDHVEKIKRLKLIDMRYNYLSEEMRAKLRKLPVKVDVNEAEEYDDEWMSPMITE